MDNLNPDATIAHAVIILNGLCATNSAMLEMMSFELERAFGRILGLDYAQVNPGALSNGEIDGTLGSASSPASLSFDSRVWANLKFTPASGEPRTFALAKAELSETQIWEQFAQAVRGKGESTQRRDGS